MLYVCVMAKMEVDDVEVAYDADLDSIQMGIGRSDGPIDPLMYSRKS